MKPLLKILLVLALLVGLSGCSAQRRAERHLRKAVALCPELVQVKAHPIDTVLTAPGFADAAAFPLASLVQGDTLYAATAHGTVVVSLCQSDSTLRAGFVAAPQEIRYKDTLRYASVEPARLEVVPKENEFFGEFITGIFCILLGFVLAVYLIFRNNKTIK